MTIMIVVFHLELMTIHLFKITEVQEQGYFALFALLPLAAFLVFCLLFVFVFYCFLEVAFAPSIVLFFLLSNFPNFSVRLLVDTLIPVVKCSFSIVAFFALSVLQLVKTKLSLQYLSWWVMLLAFSCYYTSSTVVVTFSTCMWNSN